MKNAKTQKIISTLMFSMLILNVGVAGFVTLFKAAGNPTKTTIPSTYYNQQLSYHYFVVNMNSNTTAYIESENNIKSPIYSFNKDYQILLALTEIDTISYSLNKDFDESQKNNSFSSITFTNESEYVWCMRIYDNGNIAICYFDDNLYYSYHIYNPENYSDIKEYVINAEIIGNS